MNNNDIIFALSSGAGRAGVAVIRVSGAGVADVARQLIGAADVRARHAYLRTLRDGADVIDTCLVTYFPAPFSFTGEDVLEIAPHGAPAVVTRIFDFLRDRFGAHLATPGEFSRRAFYNGKMDLVDVDSLAALLDARTERQRQAAVRAVAGDGAIYENWRTQMIEISAYAAAMLDYNADDLPPDIADTVRGRIDKLYAELNDAISRYAAVRAVRSGFNIVIAGPTNAGKSSLFNRIVGTNRAIVSDIPGTTRDVVSAQIDIDGYLVNLSDTAGLRTTDDVIEQIGIEKTNSEIANADLILNLGACGGADNEIHVVNKADLIKAHDAPGAIYISAKTGQGIDELMRVVREKMHAVLDGAEDSVSVNERTRTLVLDAAQNLSAAISAGDNYDIVAEHVRAAADAIGRILGVITVDEVLDATFSQLCLGK